MNAANDNLGPDDKALFCTACGSADINSSNLAGGEAGCNVCGWKGRVEDLAVFHFTHGMGSPDEVFHLFFLDMRKLFSLQFASAFAPMLLKWGFLEEVSPKSLETVRRHLARYVAGVAKAAVLSVVKTRAEIEKEKLNAKPS